MNEHWSDYLPLGLALAAIPVWLLVFGGVVDHWRRKHTVPSGAVAAFMVVVVASLFGRLILSPFYFDPTWNIQLWGHVERALLVWTGLWALAVLIRSRLRWRDATR
jgi:hypothetical protein